jgi:hypothetical protein
MEIGEEFSDNHLPWDSIDAVEHSDYEKNLTETISVLKKLSEERRDKDPKYKILLKNIKTFDDYKKRKAISLNEKKRWAEYLDEKKMLDANEEYIKKISGENKTEEEKEKEKESDLLLDEALKILVDYIDVKKTELDKVALNKKK